MSSNPRQTDTQINKRTLIYVYLHAPPPPQVKGPMGVCAEIGHLSHMMSRGRGCIIDEPKQHVSVSTHHTAMDTGGSSRKWAGREEKLLGKRILGCRKVRQKSLPWFLFMKPGGVVVQHGLLTATTSLNFSLNGHEFIQGASNLLFSCLHLTLYG